jgi:FeS assembly protein IscX
MPKLTWEDVEDIAYALYQRYPGMDPLKLRFTDLHRYITELANFGDDPKRSNESKLETIQMAWYDEWKEAE